MAETKLSPDPRLDEWQNSLWNLQMSRGPAEKWSKQFIKKWKKGEDVSSFGELADIRNRGAAAKGDVRMRYMTGANALLANTGSSDDLNQMNRMEDLANQDIDTQVGMESGRALNELGNTALQTNESARRSRYEFEAANKSAALSNRLGYYQHRYSPKTPFWQSALLAGISGASRVAGAAVGG